MTEPGLYFCSQWDSRTPQHHDPGKMDADRTHAHPQRALALLWNTPRCWLEAEEKFSHVISWWKQAESLPGQISSWCLLMVTLTLRIITVSTRSRSRNVPSLHFHSLLFTRNSKSSPSREHSPVWDVKPSPSLLLVALRNYTG